MNDKMREEFETAVALEAGEPVLAVYLSRRNETYSTSTLHFAWWAWQTSREVLVIELPKTIHAGGPDDDIYWPSDVRAAIEAAGLKVTP